MILNISQSATLGSLRPQSSNFKSSSSNNLLPIDQSFAYYIILFDSKLTKELFIKVKNPIKMQSLLT